MSSRIASLVGSLITAIGIFIVTSPAALAQNATLGGQTDTSDTGTLSEIVVTAQRREEKMVDVPISIAAIDTQQLATANVQDLRDIAQLTPSLKFENQAGFFQPSIRGIGTSVTTSGGGSNVGVYVDGFYSPDPEAANFQLLNVQGVQVLKGPQGTLFGHNTTGGAILVTTADPSTETHAEAKVSYGSFNAQRFEGYATTGLGGGVAADVEAIFTKGNGFLTNIVDNNDHIGAYENWTVRTGLKWQITDGLSVLARYTHSRQDDPTSILTNSNTDTSINPTTGKPWGLGTIAYPGFYTTNPNQVAEILPTFVRSNTDIAQLTVKADLGFADFTSYSQWRQEDVNQGLNESDAAGPSVFTPGFTELGLPIFDSTYSQELLLTSKPGTPLQWTTGVFLFSYRDQYDVNLNSYEQLPAAVYAATLGSVFPVGRLPDGAVPYGGSSVTTQSAAYYLDATYELLPNKLYFTAGARVSHDLVDSAYYNSQFFRTRVPIPGINSNKVTPRAVIRYKPTEHSSVYASFSEGYKAAILDAGGSCQDPPAYKCNPIQPEDVYAYEVGYKFESGVFSTEAAAFDYQYKNLQVSEYLQNSEAYIVNAAQSRIYGLEDEFHYNFETHVQVNGGVSWTHARYTTFGGPVLGQIVGAPVYQTCPGGPTGPLMCYAEVDSSTPVLHNTRMQYVPDYTANLGPRYTTGMTDSGEYSVSGNLYFSSYYYNSPAGTQFRQPSYTTLALRTQWQDPSLRYTVALFGNNLTNDRYRTTVAYNGEGIGAVWSAPATWGIEFGAKF
jgi:iron complex outermembrane receptor protein